MSNVTWKISIITTTPELFPGPLQYSNIGKSLAEGKWSLEIIPLEKRQNNKKVKMVPIKDIWFIPIPIISNGLASIQPNK